MNIILDTHALIWFTEGDERLSSTAEDAITDISNNKFISIASLWEIVIKSSLKKIELNRSFIEINQFLLANDIEIIGITAKHLNTLLSLPHHHGDPFDRMIISQATTENLSVISVDGHFRNYQVTVIW